MRRPIATFCVLAAVFAACTLSPVAAQAGDLVVKPRNPKTIFRTQDGVYEPRKLKYRVSTTAGKRTWVLRSRKTMFTGTPPSGKARKRAKRVVVTPNDARIGALAPGIYDLRLVWRAKGRGNKRVKRNVSLVVEGDAAAGLSYFTNSCSGCHDIGVNKNGPRLGGVYGRKAGTVPGFSYSDALVAYGEVWEERTLNAWLMNPQKLVPGANMYVLVTDPVDRMNLIAYLKSVSP